MKDKKIDEVIKSVLGTKRTAAILKKEVSQSVMINLTINAVIKEWENKYTKDELFQQHIRGEVVFARNTIIVVCNKLTLLNAKDLHSYIDMQSVGVKHIRRIIQRFRDLDSKNKFDKAIIDKAERIMAIVISETKDKK